MPEPLEPSKPRKRQARRASPIDKFMQRERGQMEVQMRRNAVLEYVAEQLAELNDLLRDAGFRPVPLAHPQAQFSPPAPPQPLSVAATSSAYPPCTWCGGGKPTKAFNVGNGVMQYLCAAHVGMGVTRQQVDGEGKSLVTNATDARPQPPVMNSGKVLMQPLPQDEQRAQQHAQQHAVESDGVTAKQAFEELGENE